MPHDPVLRVHTIIASVFVIAAVVLAPMCLKRRSFPFAVRVYVTLSIVYAAVSGLTDVFLDLQNPGRPAIVVLPGLSPLGQDIVFAIAGLLGTAYMVWGWLRGRKKRHGEQDR